MNALLLIRKSLHIAAQNFSTNPARFFKTEPGQYAAHDQFIGVPVPILRKIAKAYSNIPFKQLSDLINSKINEERLLALLIVVAQYQKGTPEHKQACYNWYVAHLEQVNNWNLVDSSAPYIMGAHVHHKDQQVLFTLAASETMWHRRIAIVATWYLIRQQELKTTFALAELLLQDSQDLMHKAVGWMLREAGKKDQSALRTFLDVHACRMPRTMLRYAIEKFSKEEQRNICNASKRNSFENNPLQQS